LLNVLSDFIPEQERIVTIEDAAELQLKQDHLVRLETRPPNIDLVLRGLGLPMKFPRKSGQADKP